MNKDRNRKIYVYTTKTYLAKGWYKIGETTQDVEERVRQQDVTSSAEKLIVVDSWNSPDFSDKDFHVTGSGMQLLAVSIRLKSSITRCLAAASARTVIKCALNSKSVMMSA